MNWSISIVIFVLITTQSQLLQAFESRVLYFGDSHSVIRSDENAKVPRLGNVLIDRFKKIDKEVDYLAACGARVKTWFNGGRTDCGYSEFTDSSSTFRIKSRVTSIKSFFKKDLHDVVIINLGDNNFRWQKQKANGPYVSSFDEDVKQNLVDEVLAITDLLAQNRQCFWVGPTYHIRGPIYFKKDSDIDALYDTLAEVLEGRCTLIDSRPMIVTTVKNDGVHHISKDSRTWGHGIADALGLPK